MRRCCLLIVWLVPLPVGCSPQSESEELPGYEVAIPADVPERLVIHNKDGTTTTVNGREMYARAHREGWADFWRRYQQGTLDPADQSAEPVAMGEPSEAALARWHGFEACRRTILRMRQ